MSIFGSVLSGENMIFLGAGASKTFGIKTLQEMSQDLTALMVKEGYETLVNEITQKLSRFGVVTDFEGIYTIVEGIADFQHAISYYGPFVAYICPDISQARPKQDYEELSKIFRSYLYNECKKCDPKLIESVYDKLFATTHGSGIVEKRYGDGSESGQEPSVNVDYTIATTNYDMIVEFYHRIREQDYADGFRQTKNALVKELDLLTYSRKIERWLIKLHGSIWQYKYENKVFKTHEDPQFLSIPVEIQEEAMIYPTGEKPILRHPYFEFYNVFRIQKWDVLIVIGYSFRDEPVNVAILENMQKQKDSLMIVIDPEAEKVIQNLGNSAKLSNRIIRIPKKFGEPTMFEKLELALKVTRAGGNWLRYQEREREEKLKGAALPN